MSRRGVTLLKPIKVSAPRKGGVISPLRYPGGKAVLAGLFTRLIRELDIQTPVYVEPYAGGAGAGIVLLREGVIDRLVINDLDPAVYAFWRTITEQTERFVERVQTVALTIDEWRFQRQIYRECDESDLFSLGFAFFYLNRTNRSGVLNAGVIGGLAQKGAYKIDARFNRKTLSERITAIGKLSKRITVTNRDGRVAIEKYASVPEAFIYIDPPYVQAGSRLYLNAFDDRDHYSLARAVDAINSAHWLMTYDTAPLIERLYTNQYMRRYELNYSARHPGPSNELMITSPSIARLLKKSLF